MVAFLGSSNNHYKSYQNCDTLAATKNDKMFCLLNHVGPEVPAADDVPRPAVPVAGGLEAGQT